MTTRLLIALLCVPLFAAAQPVPDTLWTRAYGTAISDVAYNVIQTADSGFLLTGTHDQLNPQIYAVKTDARGEPQWARVYGSPPWGDFADAWAVGGGSLAGGGILVAASVAYYGQAGGAAGYLLRCAANGDTLSTLRVDGAGSALFTHLDAAGDGGFIVTGLTFDDDTTTDDQDVLLLRLNSAGDVLWWTAITTAAPAYPACVRAADDGYLITGETVSLDDGDSDGFLLKADLTGDTLWTRTYDLPADEALRSVRELPDGGLIMAGHTIASGVPRGDIWLVRADAAGNLLWQRTYGGAESEAGYDVWPLADGRFAVLGDTTISSANVDVCLLIVDAAGTPQDCRRYGGANGDVAQRIAPTADGGFAAAGWTWSFGNGSDDFYLLRFGYPAAAGNGPELYPASIALAASPNPFNAVTRVTYELPRAVHAAIAVFDVTGRTVRTLRDDPQSAGTHELRFDARELPSGMYFIRLQAGDVAVTRKVLLLK